MASFGYRLNPRYAIKECLSCGALYTKDCSCSKGNVDDKILVPKLPEICARCGHPVNGSYCQGCALLREKLKEDLVTYLKYFQDTFESSNDSTNVANAPREPFVVKQDHGVNPPHIDNCCCECGNALDGIFCQQCICKSCGKGAHTGYNFPPKVLIISNPEPYNQTMNNELPQTLPSFDSTCYSKKENSVPCVSKPNFVDESSNIFNPPPKPPIYSCEFCRSNAQYVHYCTPQSLFINLEPSYSQDFNFPQNIHDFQQQYLCCDQCGGPHETFQYFPEEIFSNPLFEEEIISIKIDQHHFNAESDLVESLLNRDSSIISSSSKTDPLLDEFAGELTLLKSIPPRVDETNCYPENEIRFAERLLYDNLSPRLPEEFVFDNSNVETECFSPSPIPNEDSDPFIEEIDLFLTPDDLMPPSIKDDDDDSKRDILIHEELLDNYSLSPPVNESFCFDIPLFSRPPAKPPDGNTGILNIKIMGDVSDQKIPVCFDDDDDYSAITPNKPIGSLSMWDEHLDTNPETESDEFIKSCVETIVPNP
nr:hypothetical protein [Tanacetum cinerariifolium]